MRYERAPRSRADTAGQNSRRRRPFFSPLRADPTLSVCHHARWRSAPWARTAANPSTSRSRSSRSWGISSERAATAQQACAAFAAATGAHLHPARSLRCSSSSAGTTRLRRRRARSAVVALVALCACVEGAARMLPHGGRQLLAAAVDRPPTRSERPGGFRVRHRRAASAALVGDDAAMDAAFAFVGARFPGRSDRTHPRTCGGGGARPALRLGVETSDAPPGAPPFRTPSASSRALAATRDDEVACARFRPRDDDHRGVQELRRRGAAAATSCRQSTDRDAPVAGGARRGVRTPTSNRRSRRRQRASPRRAWKRRETRCRGGAQTWRGAPGSRSRDGRFRKKSAAIRSSRHNARPALHLRHLRVAAADQRVAKLRNHPSNALRRVVLVPKRRRRDASLDRPHAAAPSSANSARTASSSPPDASPSRVGVVRSAAPATTHPPARARASLFAASSLTAASGTPSKETHAVRRGGARRLPSALAPPARRVGGRPFPRRRRGRRRHLRRLLLLSEPPSSSPRRRRPNPGVVPRCRCHFRYRGLAKGGVQEQVDALLLVRVRVRVVDVPPRGRELRGGALRGVGEAASKARGSPPGRSTGRVRVIFFGVFASPMTLAPASHLSSRVRLAPAVLQGSRSPLPVHLRERLRERAVGVDRAGPVPSPPRRRRAARRAASPANCSAVRRQSTQCDRRTPLRRRHERVRRAPRRGRNRDRAGSHGLDPRPAPKVARGSPPRVADGARNQNAAPRRDP